MILIKPTTHGYGVQIIGTREDLETLYVAIGKCWNPEEPTTQSNMLASFSYDIHHTFMGMRDTRVINPVTKENGTFFAMNYTWSTMVTYLATLRYHMARCVVSQDDFEVIEEFFDMFIDCLEEFAGKRAQDMLPYIEGDAFYVANPYLMQYWEHLELDFLDTMRFGTKKSGINGLGKMLTVCSYATDEYNYFLRILKKEAKRLNCEITELRTAGDDQFEVNKW